MREMETAVLGVSIERLPERQRYVLVHRYGLGERDLSTLRADERTRTTHLLITSARSCVAGRCRGLQIPLT
jgi:hypothetical protein